MFRLDGSRGYTDLLGSDDGELDGYIDRLALGTGYLLYVLPRGSTRSPVDVDVDCVRRLLEASREDRRCRARECAAPAPRPRGAHVGARGGSDAARPRRGPDVARRGEEHASEPCGRGRQCDRHDACATSAACGARGSATGRLQHSTPPGRPRRRATSSGLLARSARGLGGPRPVAQAGAPRRSAMTAAAPGPAAGDCGVRR